MNAGEFINQVSGLTGLNRDESAIATEIVMGFVSHRIQQEEAEDVESQLPLGIKELWKSERSLGFADRIFNLRLDYDSREEFYSLIQNELKEEEITESAGRIVYAVFRTLKDQVSEGQARHIWANLPIDIQEIWEAS